MSTATATTPRAAALPTALLAFAALLAAIGVADTTGSGTGYAAVASVFAVGLLASVRDWLPRRSGKVALLLALGSLGVALAVGAPLGPIAAAAARMSDSLVLLVCVGLMRPGLAALQLDHAIAQQIARVPAILRPAALVIGSACGALGGSFGAVATVGAALGDRATPPAVAARASMRGLVLSMLLGPSVASVAAVLALFPSVSWGTSLKLGIPLAVAGAMLACIGQPRIAISAGARGGRQGWQALAAVLAVPLVAAALRALTGLTPTVAISFGCAAVALTLIALAHRGEFTIATAQADTHLRAAWRQASAEMALFLAAGLVVGVMREPAIAAGARALAAWLPSGTPGILCLLLLTPLAGAASIHPMAVFAILGPSIPAGALGIDDTGLYATWIIGIGLSMLVSPASILTMMTATTFGLPVSAVGLRANAVFAAGFAVVAALIIPLIKV